MGNDRIEIDFHAAMESADALDQIAADLENALNNSYGEAKSGSAQGTDPELCQTDSFGGGGSEKNRKPDPQGGIAGENAG